MNCACTGFFCGRQVEPWMECCAAERSAWKENHLQRGRALSRSEESTGDREVFTAMVGERGEVGDENEVLIGTQPRRRERQPS